MQCITFQPIYHQNSSYLIHKAAAAAAAERARLCSTEHTVGRTNRPWSMSFFDSQAVWATLNRKRISILGLPLHLLVLSPSFIHSAAHALKPVSYAASRNSDREASKKTWPKNTSGQLWAVARRSLSWTAVFPFSHPQVVSQWDYQQRSACHQGSAVCHSVRSSSSMITCRCLADILSMSLVIQVFGHKPKCWTKLRLNR